MKSRKTIFFLLTPRCCSPVVLTIKQNLYVLCRAKNQTPVTREKAVVTVFVRKLRATFLSRLLLVAPLLSLIIRCSGTRSVLRYEENITAHLALHVLAFS